MKSRIIQHLANDYTEAIRDPVWKNIYLSPEMLDIVNLEIVQKLNRIKQLGPAYLVYPGATHTRLNHSLGVFHIAKRLIERLLMREGEIDFSLEGVKAFLLAALLHDLGHYPFAHSLKDLDLESHESLTAQMLNERLSVRIRNQLGIEPRLVASIIDPNIDCPGFDNVTFFRNLLSGVLDPDKLDYLNRDAYFCGVPYGIQDVDFILNEVVPYRKNGIAISEKGLSSVESILFSKYLMYKTIYWHKTVRVATSMVKKAIFLGLSSGEIEKKDLYWLDDEEFFERFSRDNLPAFELIRYVKKRKLYKALGSLPFSEKNSFHLTLEKLEKRCEFERAIAEEATSISGKKIYEHEIIIDIPERISFEIDLPVYGRGEEDFIAFEDSGSVFNVQSIKNFTRSLRKVTLITSRRPEIIDAVKKIGMERILRHGEEVFSG